MSGRPIVPLTFEQRVDDVSDHPLWCDCAIPVPSVIRFYGMDAGDCAVCRRLIKKENP